MIRSARTLAAAGVLTATVLVLAACGSTTAEPAPVSSPILPTVTLSPEEQAVIDAKAAFTRFLVADDEITSNLTNPLDGYDAVAVSGELVNVKYNVSDQRKRGFHTTGTTSIVSMEPTRTSLTYEPTAKPPRIPFVTLKVCSDASGLLIVNEKTGQTKAFDMPRQSRVVIVSNDTGLFTDSGSWKVSLLGDKVTPC